MKVEQLIEPDRVHKHVYTDQAIFDAEMEKIWSAPGRIADMNHKSRPQATTTR